MKLIERVPNEEETLEKLDSLLSPLLHKFDLTQPRDRRKFEELNEVAVLLSVYFPEWRISTLREEPDFIINNGIKKVGLEHTVILDGKLRSRQGSIEYLFQKAENTIISKHKYFNFLANIYIRNNYIPKKSETDNDIREICRVIEICLSNKNYGIYGKNYNEIESYIIDWLSISPHDRMSLHANLGTWWQSALSQENIFETINKKEKLVEKYIKNTGLEQWLLLVVGHTGESSYAIFDNYRLILNSLFERIYLFEITPCKLFRIK